MKTTKYSVLIVLAIASLLSSAAVAGFVRFKKPNSSTPPKTSPTIPDPALANTIWVGKATLTVEKVYFFKDSDQRNAIISSRLDTQLEIWFRTDKTFTVLIDTRNMDYAPDHRRYEMMLGDQLGLNFDGGPCEGYRSTGILDTSKHTFTGSKDEFPPAWDAEDVPDCTTKVSGTYNFTGSSADPVLNASVTWVQVPWDSNDEEEKGVAVKGAIASGTFKKDTTRTVTGEIAAGRFVDSPNP